MHGKTLIALACCFALFQIAEAVIPVIAPGANAITIAAGSRIADNLILGGPATVICAMGTTGADNSSYTCSPTALVNAVAIATGIAITRNAMATTPGTETVVVIVYDAAGTFDVLEVTLTITIDNNAYWTSEPGYSFTLSTAVAAGATIGTATPTIPTGGTLTSITSSNPLFTSTTAGVISSVNAIAADAVKSYSFTLTTSHGGSGKAGTTIVSIDVLHSSLCESSAPMITATITILLAAVFNLVMKRL